MILGSYSTRFIITRTERKLKLDRTALGNLSSNLSNFAEFEFKALCIVSTTKDNNFLKDVY